MDLLLGSHVREHGNRVGRLAGFEVEPATLTLHRLIISADGDVKNNPTSRPVSSIALVHDGGEIELRPFGDDTAGSAHAGAALVGRATRLRAHNRNVGHLVGLEIEPGERKVLTVFARQHLWSRRSDWPAKDFDFSTPGEISSRGPGNRAA
jgi:hypothetical protein